MHLRFGRYGPKLGTSRKGWVDTVDDKLCLILLLHAMHAVVSTRLHPGAKEMSQTALFYAAKQGHVETIRFLLSKGPGPQCCWHEWRDCVAGLAMELLFVFSWWDGGQNFAGEQFVWQWGLPLRGRIFIWPFFVEFCSAGQIPNPRKRVPV